MGYETDLTVFDKSFWDRPPSRAQGDQNPNYIYTAVGKALSTWATADQAMADLFIALAGCDEAASRFAVRRAYGAIETTSLRCKAVQAAAEIYFAPWWNCETVRQSVTDIMNAVGWASHRRDDIAHGIVWLNILVDGKSHGGFLMAPEFNTDITHPTVEVENDPARFMRARYRYTSDDIYLIDYKFNVLFETIREYTTSIVKPAPGRLPPLIERMSSDGPI